MSAMFLTSLCVLCGLVLVAVPSGAATITWIGPSNQSAIGDWHKAPMWSPATVPGPNDDVVFPIDASSSVECRANISLHAGTKIFSVGSLTMGTASNGPAVENRSAVSPRIGGCGRVTLVVWRCAVNASTTVTVGANAKVTTVGGRLLTPAPTNGTTPASRREANGIHIVDGGVVASGGGTELAGAVFIAGGILNGMESNINIGPDTPLVVRSGGKVLLGGDWGMIFFDGATMSITGAGSVLSIGSGGTTLLKGHHTVSGGARVVIADNATAQFGNCDVSFESAVVLGVGAKLELSGVAAKLSNSPSSAVFHTCGQGAILTLEMANAVISGDKICGNGYLMPMFISPQSALAFTSTGVVKIATMFVGGLLEVAGTLQASVLTVNGGAEVVPIPLPKLSSSATVPSLVIGKLTLSGSTVSVPRVTANDLSVFEATFVGAHVSVLHRLSFPGVLRVASQAEVVCGPACVPVMPQMITIVEGVAAPTAHLSQMSPLLRHPAQSLLRQPQGPVSSMAAPHGTVRFEHNVTVERFLISRNVTLVFDAAPKTGSATLFGSSTDKGGKKVMGGLTKAWGARVGPHLTVSGTLVVTSGAFMARAVVMTSGDIRGEAAFTVGQVTPSGLGCRKVACSCGNSTRTIPLVNISCPAGKGLQCQCA